MYEGLSESINSKRGLTSTGNWLSGTRFSDQSVGHPTTCSEQVFLILIKSKVEFAIVCVAAASALTIEVSNTNTANVLGQHASATDIPARTTVVSCIAVARLERSWMAEGNSGGGVGWLALGLTWAGMSEANNSHAISRQTATATPKAQPALIPLHSGWTVTAGCSC